MTVWIRTADGKLVNTDAIERIGVSNTGVIVVSAATDNDLLIATGTKEEMTAVLDRIARALAAGLPFLDLGTPENGTNAELLAVSGTGPFTAQVWSNGRLVATSWGLTVDAAIANLKPTGK